MAKLTIKDLDLKGKKVLMRTDFNVPLDDHLEITDDARIRANLPTIKYILEKGADKLILMSHLGRPKGKVVQKYSLRPVSKRLQELLGACVEMLNDCVGEKIKQEINASKEKVILLENLRFHAEEENNDTDFAKQLAELGDVFVNDAFGTAHRAHASTEGITKYLKSAAGFLLNKEIQYLDEALKDPVRPFVVILGGAKVSDKIGVINNLLPKSDAILIGGGMAYTFLFAKGIQVGNSKLEKDKVNEAVGILDNAARLKKEIVLPIDHLVVDKVESNSPCEVAREQVPQGKIAVDIGAQTIDLFKSKLKNSKTIVWNGPLGIFEMEPFSHGTEEIARFISGLSATTIIGGGDTSAAIAKFGLEDKMTHISTGGGACLEFMEGKLLPGIAALTDK